jgi:hypothetical protein
MSWETNAKGENSSIANLFSDLIYTFWRTSRMLSRREPATDS